MKTTGRKTKAEASAFDAEGYQTNLRRLNRTPLPDLAVTTAKPFAWGGARAGAGRKPSGRQPVLLRLTPKTVRHLRTTARKQGKTLSHLAEELLASA
ncbi:MAG: hypothetical protein HZA93_05775 [Verrucomicrobia bacterium]|nr:hypothetical protein [Verrucomicrobiota bacterium]